MIRYRHVLMVIVGLAFAVGCRGTSAVQQQGHDDGNTNNSRHLHEKPTTLPPFQRHQQSGSSYRTTHGAPESTTARAAPAVTKASGTPALATIHTNQHGLIAVTVLVEQEQIYCHQNSPQNLTMSLSSPPPFLWTVTVEEASVSSSSKTTTSTGTSVSSRIKPALRLSKTLSLKWSSTETTPLRSASSTIQDTGAGEGDDNDAFSAISFAGSASCSFVIPLESYPGDADADAGSQDLPLSSLMHMSAAARTFIVSLWMTASSTESEQQDWDEARNHQQRHLIMRRLATLPRMANPKQTIDPVAKVVLEHTLPMDEQSCQEMQQEAVLHQEPSSKNEDGLLGQLFWLAVISLVASVCGNFRPRIKRTQPSLHHSIAGATRSDQQEEMVHEPKSDTENLEDVFGAGEDTAGETHRSPSASESTSATAVTSPQPRDTGHDAEGLEESLGGRHDKAGETHRSHSVARATDVTAARSPQPHDDGRDTDALEEDGGADKANANCMLSASNAPERFEKADISVSLEGEDNADESRSPSASNPTTSPIATSRDEEEENNEEKETHEHSDEDDQAYIEEEHGKSIEDELQMTEEPNIEIDDEGSEKHPTNEAGEDGLDRVAKNLSAADEEQVFANESQAAEDGHSQDSHRMAENSKQPSQGDDEDDDDLANQPQEATKAPLQDNRAIAENSEQYSQSDQDERLANESQEVNSSRLEDNHVLTHNPEQPSHGDEENTFARESEVAEGSYLEDTLKIQSSKTNVLSQEDDGPEKTSLLEEEEVEEHHLMPTQQENFEPASSPAKEAEEHLLLPTQTEDVEQTSLLAEDLEEQHHTPSHFDVISSETEPPFEQEANDIFRREDSGDNDPQSHERSPTAVEARTDGSVRLEEAAHVVKKIFENTQRGSIRVQPIEKNHNEFAGSFYPSPVQEDKKQSPARDGNASDAEDSYESTLPPDSDYQSEDDQLVFPPTDNDHHAIDDKAPAFEENGFQYDVNESEIGAEVENQASIFKDNASQNDGSEKENDVKATADFSPADFNTNEPKPRDDARKPAYVSKGSDFSITPPRESVEGEVPGVPRKKNRQETTAQGLDEKSPTPDCFEVAPPPFIKKRKKRPYKNSSIVADHVPSNKLQTTSQIFVHQEKAVKIAAKPSIKPSSGSKSEKPSNSGKNDANPRKRALIPKTITLTTARKKARTDAIVEHL